MKPKLLLGNLDKSTSRSPKLSCVHRSSRARFTVSLGLDQMDLAADFLDHAFRLNQSQGGNYILQRWQR